MSRFGVLALLVSLVVGCASEEERPNADAVDASFVDGDTTKDSSVVDAGPSNRVCEAVIAEPCPEGCMTQNGYVLADGGACYVPVWMHCGGPVEAVTFEVQCWVRLTDGLILRTPTRTATMPLERFRRCTQDEERATENSGPYYFYCP
ncbi:MAG: hypothetical protein U0169_00540 [Polyangiaceae bacterium]